NNAEYVTPQDMLSELRDDNKELTARMRETHGLCDEGGDVATASLLEVWIDEAERRTWFLFEASRVKRSRVPDVRSGSAERVAFARETTTRALVASTGHHRSAATHERGGRPMIHDPANAALTASRTDTKLRGLLGGMSVFTMIMTIPQVWAI